VGLDSDLFEYCTFGDGLVPVPEIRRDIRDVEAADVSGFDAVMASRSGHCRRAQPLIAEALAAHPGVRHLKVADASGKPLGRSFGVKLWPTLIFLKDGKETARLVRPRDAGPIGTALAAIER
jgi:thiol-disulfide isomerase/thioredoxin